MSMTCLLLSFYTTSQFSIIGRRCIFGHLKEVALSIPNSKNLVITAQMSGLLLEKGSHNGGDATLTTATIPGTITATARDTIEMDSNSH